MHDLHVVDDAFVGSVTRLALEDHDNRKRPPSVGGGCSHARDEVACGAGAVPPPSGRPRSDDVGRINQEHGSSRSLFWRADRAQRGERATEAIALLRSAAAASASGMVTPNVRPLSNSR